MLIQSVWADSQWYNYKFAIGGKPFPIYFPSKGLCLFTQSRMSIFGFRDFWSQPSDEVVSIVKLLDSRGTAHPILHQKQQNKTIDSQQLSCRARFEHTNSQVYGRFEVASSSNLCAPECFCLFFVLSGECLLFVGVLRFAQSAFIRSVQPETLLKNLFVYG